jgi:hypothetical protein
VIDITIFRPIVLENVLVNQFILLVKVFGKKAVFNAQRYKQTPYKTI